MEESITLLPEDTKADEARLMLLTAAQMEMFKAMPRGLPNVPEFTYQGTSVASVMVGFRRACKRAQIGDFIFHDLTHTAINNCWQAGHDYFQTMPVSGHKTMNVFKRYNTVSRSELKALVGIKI